MLESSGRRDRETMQIFLSYAHSDQALAKSLASELAKRGLSVWRDEAELLPGDNVWLRTGEALKKSKAMVVLVSPDAMRSDHVRREIQYALGDPGYEGRLFPVRVRPTPSMPWILKEFEIFNAAQGAAKVSEAITDALKQVA